MTKNLAALFAAVAATAALVTACGGGGGSDVVTPVPPSPPTSPPPPPSTPRGTLISAASTGSLSTSDVDSFDSDTKDGPVKAGETATCSVSLLKLQYATVDHAGNKLTASAGLLVPSKDPKNASGTCLGAHPLLSFQHGTSDTIGFDGSDKTGIAPLTMAKYFASHGYVVVIPDYLGYGTTSNHYHPYVIAESDAATVIDAVRAARNWFPTADGVASGVTLSSQLFLTGTSEGGYVTMATHRTMERDFPSEFTITADVPISGPYDLATEVRNDLLGADASGNSATGGSTFLLTSYQAEYGDLYATPADIFQTPWADSVVGLFPGAYGSDNEAVKACKIPYSLDTAPGKPAGNCPSFNPLLQPQFVTDYLANTPGTHGGITAAHVGDNDLLQGWANSGKNKGPMTICYGDKDVVATPNATAAATFFGSTATLVDAQTTTDQPFIASWMVANSTGSNALVYHGQVEGPGCTAYARYGVFDTFYTPI